jgi:hypothetical protein
MPHSVVFSERRDALQRVYLYYNSHMIGSRDKGTRPALEQSKPPKAPSSGVNGQGLRLTSQTGVKKRPE